MFTLRGIFLIFLFVSAGSVTVGGQGVGSLEVSGRVKIGGKPEKLLRKRFYLLPGGLDDNRALIDRLKAAKVSSRDCFYCQMKASPEYIDWLKSGGCESPYCREITTEDTKTVPEFQAAFQKSLKQYRGKPEIARKWLTTNLATGLRDGFYSDRKSLLETLLSDVRPIQSTMTDSVSVKAIFIDVALKSGTDTFLISNLVPIEIGEKSYVWACETKIGSDKKITLSLPDAETGKLVRKCEVIVRDLPTCTAQTCGTK